MPATFEHDGETFELLTNIDDLDIGDAEILEDEVGIDLKSFATLKFTKQLKLFILMSIRRKRADFTLDDCRRVKLSPIVAAINAGTEPATEPEPEAVDGAVLSPSNAGSGESPAAADAPPARKASKRTASATARRSRTTSTSAPGKSTS